MSLSRAMLIFTLSLSYFVHPGRAVNCTLDNWSWATNSLGQNPCTVVEQLEGACWNMVYILDPLTSGTNYVTPQTNSNPSCECNTVMYSLYQACTACQNATIESWNFYEQFCNAVYVTEYPVQIPLSTRIPHWAYLNVTVKGSWNEQDSITAADQPESTPPSPSTASIPGSSTSSSSSGPSFSTNSHESGTSPPPSPTIATTKSSNTGTIAGGAVGGIVGLALIGGAIAYMLYRKRQAAAAEATLDMSYSDSLLHAPVPPMSSQPLKPYDPSDPSTFPVPLEQTGHSGNNNSGDASIYPLTTAPLAPLNRGYRGFAEV